MRWTSPGREKQLLSGAPVLWLEGRGRMCLEESGFRSAEGRGLQEDQITFRGWENRFSRRRVATAQ